MWGDSFSTVGDTFSTVEVVQYSFGFGCTIVLIVIQAGNSKVLVQKSNSQFSKTKVNTEPKKCM